MHSLRSEQVYTKGKHADDLISNNKVKFNATQYGSGWQYSPLCGERSLMGDLDEKACKGKIMGYYITYEISGKKKGLTLKYKYIRRK